MPIELEETLERITLILNTINGKQISQMELARQTGINYNTLRRLIEVMENKQLITRKTNPGPPRQIILQITPKGECLLKCLTT